MDTEPEQAKNKCEDEPRSCSEEPLSEDDGGTVALLRPSNNNKEDADTGGEEESSDLPPAPPISYHCGCGPWRPRCLQRMVSAKLFTALLCTYSLIEGTTVSGYRTVVISSIEKRYHFSSIAASVILTMFDIAVIMSVVFISYFGHKSHKPRILGIGMIIQGLGALILATPQFLFGGYNVGSNSNFDLESCNAHSEGPSCDPANTAAYVIFLAGNFILGIGAAPLFTVGTSFIDDIVHPKYVSIHLGIFYAMAIVGPAIGYGLGGAFLSMFVDPWESTSLEQSDPGWVGAWWLCFLTVGIASILFSIPFLMFPRLLPDSHLIMEERKKEMVVEYTNRQREETSLLAQLKTFPAHFKKLFTSWTWLCVTIAISCAFFSLDGMIAFGPKYLEAQFGLTSSTASLTLGAIAIPTGGVGVLLGAVLVYLVKSKAKRVAMINWIVTIISVFPAVGAFLVSCSDLPVAGINTPYPNSSINSTTDVLLASCNADCNCTSTIFEPVCGADGLTYFSPCRASCDKYYVNGNSDQTMFENCSCVADGLQGNMTHWINATATSGRCTSDCHTLPLFLFFIGLFLLLIFTLKIPTVIVTIRSVADEQRTLALGVQSVMFRAFGSVPGPLLFGTIFDSACVYFRYECGVQGNCWVYDNQRLSIGAIALGAAGLTANFGFSLLAWLVYPKHKRTLKSQNNETVRFVELMDQDEDFIEEEEMGNAQDHFTPTDYNVEVTEHTNL